MSKSANVQSEMVLVCTTHATSAPTARAQRPITVLTPTNCETHEQPTLRQWVVPLSLLPVLASLFLTHHTSKSRGGWSLLQSPRL